MHPNPAFRTQTREENLAFVRDRGFGQLCVNGDGGPLAAHVPFLIDAEGQSVELHLLRSNPIARHLSDGPAPALLSVTGPDGYISPDWYAIPDQVPTWNYVAVHLRGPLEAAAPTELHPMLDRLSAAFEARLEPKRPWTTDKMPSDLMARMMRTIQPFRLRIESVEGTWKLNQNKTDAARAAAADMLEAFGEGEAALLAALMRGAAET
ncbi:MAG: FMN-binding negative transcriptional regulator [Pseudomonadota bacterium]